MMYGHVARYVTRTRIGSDLYAWCTTLYRAGHYGRISLPSTCVVHACFYRGANAHLQRSAQEFEDNCTIWLARLTDSLCARESGETTRLIRLSLLREPNNISANISVFAFRIEFLCHRFSYNVRPATSTLSSKQVRVPRIYFRRDRPSSRYQGGRIPARCRRASFEDPSDAVDHLVDRPTRRAFSVFRRPLIVRNASRCRAR